VDGDIQVVLFMVESRLADQHEWERAASIATPKKPVNITQVHTVHTHDYFHESCVKSMRLLHATEQYLGT
jgi:hypothetical protein